MFVIDSKAKSSRTPHPRGFTNAVCADFYTKESEDRYNPGQMKTDVVLTFVTPTIITDRDGNKRNASISLFAKATWGSADKRSNLYKFITSWFGPLPDEKLKSFDFEKLVGRKVCILVEHYIKQDGSTGDKVALATDLRGDLPQIDGIPSDFVKMADRKPRPEAAPDPSGSAPTRADDDLPF